MHGHYLLGLKWYSFRPLPTAVAGAAWWCYRVGRCGGMVACLPVIAISLTGGLAAGGVLAVDGSKAPRPLVEVRLAAYRSRNPCRLLRLLPAQPGIYCRREVVHLGSVLDVQGFLPHPAAELSFRTGHRMDPGVWRTAFDLVWFWPDTMICTAAARCCW